MSINPAALLLLVVGFVAVIVGVKGTQRTAAQLITGVPADKAATGDPMNRHPSSSASSGLGPHAGVAGGGGGGGGGSW